MATLIPVTGSFTEYAQRFIDDSLAFGLGWAYWYLWVTVGSSCPSTLTVSPDQFRSLPMNTMPSRLLWDTGLMLYLNGAGYSSSGSYFLVCLT
jgi:amino acid transporter